MSKAAFILALLFVCAANAQSQAPMHSTVIFPSNDQQAVYTAGPAEHSLLTGGQTSAHGEQPLAQYGTRMFEPYIEDNPTFSPNVPLGDVARYYRRKKEEHAEAK